MRIAAAIRRPYQHAKSHLVSNLERNKQVVVDYYTTAFAGDPERAVAEHFGPRYVQHNPDAQDGPEAFIGFVKWLRGEYPNLHLHIKRVIAEGDLVATHSHLDLEPGNPDNPRGGLSPTSSYRRTARLSSIGTSSRTCPALPRTTTGCSDARRRLIAGRPWAN